MEKKKLLFVLPRTLVILFSLFLMIFAFDVFETGTLFEQLLGFLIHISLQVLLLVGLYFLWKKPKYACIFYLFFAVGFTLFFNTYKNFYSFLLVSITLIIIYTRKKTNKLFINCGSA